MHCALSRMVIARLQAVEPKMAARSTGSRGRGIVL